MTKMTTEIDYERVLRNALRSDGYNIENLWNVTTEQIEDTFVQRFSDSNGFRKIHAIKAVREISGMHLRSAKDFVEGIFAKVEKRNRTPQDAYQQRALLALDNIRYDIEASYADEHALDKVRTLLSIVGQERNRRQNIGQ